MTYWEKLQESNYTVYPNPSNNGIFCIQTPSSDRGLNIFIFDSMGKEILRQYFHPTNNSKLVNLSNHPTGIYFIQIAMEDKVYTRKLILE